MAEVTRQLGPTHSLLQKLHEWQLSFWSNGSGGPPGFFQTRIKADDERYRRLEDETNSQSTILSEVHDFMVSQVAARAAREKAEVEHAERVKKALLVVKWAAGVLITLLTWGATRVVPVVKILVDDYLKTHPYVSQELQKRSASSSESVYAERNQQSVHTPMI